MPLPRRLARFNKRVTNGVLRHLAVRAPLLGILSHRGRRSGSLYSTPLSVFPRPGGYVIALTYGPGCDWTRNVLAAGGAALETRGRRYRLTNPRLVHDPRRALMPVPVRLVLALIGAADFLLLDTLDG